MSSVEIVFTKSKKKFPIASWLIRWWTGKPYSHVACGIQVSDWGKNYFQASEGKINYEHEPYFLEKHEIVKKYTLTIPKEIERTLKKRFYQSSGLVYGTLQNLGIVYVDLVKYLFGKKIHNPWKKGENCSEFMYVDLIQVLLSDMNEYNKDTIKPHEIEDIILSRLMEYVNN